MLEGGRKDCKSRNTRKSPSLLEMTGKKKKPPEQLQSSKMHKGKKCQGEEGGSRPSHCEVTGGQKKKKEKKIASPLFDKRPKNFSNGQDIQL